MKVYGLTNIGTIRPENQDCFAVHELSGGILAVVCDGMGGAAAGQVASQLACKEFSDYAVTALEAGQYSKVAECLAGAADIANREVYRASMTDSNLEGMGTTLVASFATDTNVIFINVGDSAAYRISRGSIRKITHDHSLVQDMLDRGRITPEQARRHPKKNIITRVIGGERIVRSDMFESEAEKDDVFILCSDGLTNALSEDELLQIASEQAEPRIIAETLIHAAIQNKARDNITAVVISMREEAQPHDK